MKKLSKVYTVLVFIFLFAPILVMLFFSFNDSKSLSVFSGFSLKWYQELFNDNETLNSLSNTLILAVSASVISTILGTMAAIGINKLRNKVLKSALNTVTDIPMTNPDIITGISLMLMFVFVGKLIGLSSSLNFWTMLIAHITFCLPYVIMQVLPKLQQMDKAIPEAAMDLGCRPIKAFFRVVLPEILPGVLTGLIMAFTLSLDDFVISYFTQGTGFQTLPIRIYGMTKKTVTPKMYALATLIFLAIMLLLLFSNMVENNRANQEPPAKVRKKFNLPPVVKRIALISAGCAIVFAITFLIFRNKETLELNVYNWGEYISDGSEDTLDSIEEFEKWYEKTYGQKVKVNYDTFASCEDMYNKLKSGGVSYDVIVPSDYMIERMKSEGMLLKLNFENIPNVQYISSEFSGLYYDINNEYTVPYAYGIVGIIYDANQVDEEDVGDWSLLWNEKYAGKILQYNNPRDAFGTAFYKLNQTVNSEDKALWDAAYRELAQQYPILQAMVMDEVYNLMENGEAAIACYYAGDYFTMWDNQADDVDLCFYYPNPTNYYIDAFCVPTCCQNQELAEIFINFMLSEEVAIANAEYTYYACPNSLVYENEEYIEYMEDAYEVIYPGIENFAETYNKFAYHNLSAEMLSYQTQLWEKLKVN